MGGKKERASEEGEKGEKKGAVLLGTEKAKGMVGERRTVV